MPARISSTKTATGAANQEPAASSAAVPAQRIEDRASATVATRDDVWRRWKVLRLMVGGLGMGYTLAATLDLMPPGGTVVVSELVPEVVEWNRGPLGPLAGHPLDDPRTDLVVGDVADLIRDSESRFDAVLLDVDNSVDSFTLARNSWLYTPEGLAAAHRTLRPHGALAIWSVGTEGTFERRLRRAGFTASTHPVRGRGRRGGHYSILLGRRR